MNKKPLSPLAATLGAAFLATAAFAPLASADAGFSAKPLPAGYSLAHADTEGKCGEGKCGESKKADEEGKCGEGKCGEGKCGEGKCGEGKCGGHAKDKKDKKDEKADGEGKCGEGKCGH